jgi:hypothetical protein
MRLRRNRNATGEVNQAFAAMILIMICVGSVMAAVHAATASGRDRALEERAREQAEICLEALVEDRALQGRGGALSMAKAHAIGAGNGSLAFHPEALRVAALRAVSEGGEVLMVGDSAAIGAHLVFAARPVAVELEDGRILPGILRVGVVVQ